MTTFLEEWRIRDIEHKASKAYSQLYQIQAIEIKVEGLDRICMELSSKVDNLLHRIQHLEERVNERPDGNI